MTFEQLEKMMVDEFDNNARQLTIYAELESITIEKVMEDANTTDFDAGLTKLVEKINLLFPHCPETFRNESQKRRFLRNAVIRQPWSEQAISRMTSSNLSLNDLVTALREQILLAEERSLLGRPSSTLYQRYGRNPKYLGRGPAQNRRLRPRTKNTLGRDGKRMLFRLCGSDEHLARNCPIGTFRSRICQRVQDRAPAVHVLSELVSSVEEEVPDTEEIKTNNIELAETSDLQLFDELLSTDMQPSESFPLSTSFIDKAEEKWAINHIAAALNQQSDGNAMVDGQNEEEMTCFR